MKHRTPTLSPTLERPKFYTLELETYLEQVQEKADKISDKFVGVFFILGLCLMPIYETWTFTIANSLIIAALYMIARLGLTNKSISRMVISVVYAIFMLQFIGQMHGMAEMHFFFFTNITLLIIYQDWKIMIPYGVLTILHHALLAYIQVVYDMPELAKYFITYGGMDLDGTTPNVTLFQLFFHFGLVVLMTFVAAWWTIIFRENSIRLMEKQFEAQAQNEELRSSEEELRQNAEELQSTNDQMHVIQREIEEKQKLLNRAEKLVGLASYEIDLTTQKLTHSDNLPFIYGENKLKDMKRVIEIAHPEDVYKVVNMLQDAVQGKIENYDISYRSKGEQFEEYNHYRAVGELIRDAMGNPEKLVGTVQDITESLKKEEYNQLLTTLIDNTADAMQVATTDGKFIYMNKVGLGRLGLEGEDITNYTTADIESVFKEEGVWEKHVEEVKAVDTFKLQSKNIDKRTGKEFHVEVSIKHTEVNGKGFMVALSRDTTEQQKREQEVKTKNEQLRASEEVLRKNYEELQTTQEELHRQTQRLEQIFDGVPAMIYQFKMEKDGQMSLPVVSKGAEAIYGCTSEELMNDVSLILSCVPAEDIAIFQQSLAESAQNLTTWNNDSRVVIDGKTKWVRGNSKPVKNDDGSITWSGIIQEITKQKELEEAIKDKNLELQASAEELRQNYEQLQNTQDLVSNAFAELDAQFTAISTTLGYVEMNTDRSVERVNKLFADWLGYTVEELQGHKHIEFIPNNEEDLLKYEQLWERLRTGETVTEIFKRKAKNGEEVWLYGAYCPVKDKDGNIFKIIKVASNYNSQKEYEDKIKAANYRLQNLIENVGDLVFLLDTNFVLKQYYASSDKDLLLKPQDFLQKKITELGFPDKSLQKILGALEQTMLNKEKATVEYKLELPHGTEWFSLIASPILNEEKEIDDILCVTRNITYIKKTELAVQKQNELLSQQKENIEKAFNELQTTQTQLIQAEKMASLGQLIANIAHEINTPLGAIRSSAMSIEEILGKTLPQLPSFIKQLDDDLLHSFNEFVNESIQKTDLLSTREKRTFKYDLIEQLEGMKIDNAERYADLIVDMNMHKESHLFVPFMKSDNTEEILKTAFNLSSIVRSNKTIRTATDRAAKIVFALKNYARQDQTGEKAKVNINESIETTLTLYHNQIKHGIDVTRDLDEIPEFMGYPDELVQVWTNIIHNALQAMNHKGRLFIQSSVQGNNVLVAIQDTGGGIPKEVQGKIFDAFFTTKAAGQGSGLGLDITKKIIEKHNGRIWFASLEGVGTTFFIEIPLTNN
ncbi:PAS domain S-box protein [Bernardetia sp.]|uniref:PAS domain S-box protein n=1 Tax=Bernardetia sp. TaxID=1937974 RepID=UPI0025C55841|nr:PAS domain S-box protein [Bernardetia sp.]